MNSGAKEGSPASETRSDTSKRGARGPGGPHHAELLLLLLLLLLKADTLAGRGSRAAPPSRLTHISFFPE